jgi:hypothetical protein
MVRSLLFGLDLNWQSVALFVAALALWGVRRSKGSLQLAQHVKAEGLLQCVLLWLRDREMRANPRRPLKNRKKKSRYAMDR